jgi:MraZ protein
MFLGTHPFGLDDKGRLSIPARYREVLAQQPEPGLILTIDHADSGRCIVVYPRAPFQRMAQRLFDDGPMDPGREQFARAIMAASTEVAPDRQGRILLPPGLRELVGIEREVTWVGMWNRMEIWDRQKWDVAQKNGLAEVGHLNQLLGSLGSQERSG